MAATNPRGGSQLAQIRFRNLSPLTTGLLRKHLRLQQSERRLVVGRTVATFSGYTPKELRDLLDFTISQEIPFYGANSKEIKRLRLVRQALQMAEDGIEPLLESTPDVKIIAGGDPLRERILDLLDRIWDEAAANGDSNALLLAELADSKPSAGVNYRKWLSEHL